MPKPLPSAEQLRATFRYDPRTGVLYWRRRADARANWNARFAGRRAGTTRRGRILISVTGFKLLRAHRIIWKMAHGTEPAQIDHKDGNPGNNRLDNLRAASAVQNIRNRRVRSGHSGFRGVTRRRGRWAARISVNRRDILLGLYDDPADAHEAYKRAAHRLFGEFARTD
jgi:hypothetical protein